MSHTRRVIASAVLPSLLLVCLTAAAHAQAPPANAVLTWNETAVKASTAGGQNTIQLSRAIAMVQGAVHDALNAITRRYVAYYFEEPGAPGAAPEAAVAAAAHTVLVGMVPSFGTPAQKVAASALLEDAYTTALSRVAAGPAKEHGVAVGRAAGAAMLALRKDDGATRDAPYTPGTQGTALASGGRIPIPTRRIRLSRTRTSPEAICPRISQAGAMSRPSPSSRRRSSGSPVRRR
jgi:hypothetical protein